MTKNPTADVENQLAERGFAQVCDLFPVHELEEVEHRLTDLFGLFEDLRRDTATAAWAYDMIDLNNSGGKVVQPEILHATRIDPLLRRTAMFRRLHGFARTLGLNGFCFDHAIVKLPGSVERTPWHQDIKYMSAYERRCLKSNRRLHFWVPFADATLANGCMEFVATRQRKQVRHETYTRGAATPGFEAVLPRDASIVPCPVPRGGMSIHTPTTLHAAGRNGSNAPRMAWILHFEQVSLWEQTKRKLSPVLPKALRDRRWAKADLPDLQLDR